MIYETDAYLLRGIGPCGGTLDLQASVNADSGSGLTFSYLWLAVVLVGRKAWARPVARNFDLCAPKPLASAEVLVLSCPFGNCHPVTTRLEFV